MAAIGCLGARPVAAQPVVLDCTCLSTQAVLFTNACCGTIPDLCPVAASCYIPSGFPPFGYVCSQFPAPGTPVCGTTPITFTLTETNSAAFSTTCTVNYVTGFTTNRFMIICPPTQVLPCNTTNLTFPPPVVTNLVLCCTNPVILTGPVVVTNWPVITVSWTAMQCGVVDFCQQTIVFANTNGLPCQCLDIICPSNIVVQTCLPPFTGGGGFTNIFYPAPVVSNTCLGIVTNITCTPPSGSGFPVGTNTVICTACDNLGNCATCSFDIIVEGDTIPPVVTCGPNQTVQCGSAWAPIPPTAVDNCCSNVFIMLLGSTTNITGPCMEVIEYVWHVDDCNGNFENCTNTVTVVDTIPPVMACSNYVVQCGTAGTPGGGWMPVPPAAFDACCSNVVNGVTVTLLSMVTNSGSIPCNGTILLNWQATDCCGNNSFCTELVTIVDTNPPVLSCLASNRIECGTGPFWFGSYPTAFDTCCGTNVTVSMINVVTNFKTACFSQYVLQWQASDCCTNLSTICTQVLQVVDTLPPNIICAPNKSVVCGTVWNFDPPTAIDDCCTNPPAIIVTSTTTNPVPACPMIITRTWQITDCCGNSTNCSQVVTAIDTTPPVITCGPNQTLPCNAAWSLIPPTAFDACCNSNVAISLSYTTSNTIVANCTTVITAVWQAVDCCGNAAHCTNFVTLVDTVPPVITCRSNYTVQCGSPILPPPVTDNCCLTPNVTMLNVVTNGSTPCNYTLTITWQAADCCTNTATCIELVSIVDTLPPVTTCATNKTIQCGTIWTFDAPTALDACCGTNVSIVILSTSPLTGSPCSSSSTRVWRITDCCTNSLTCTQTVTVVDTTPPVISGCGNQTLQCTLLWFWPAPPTAVDACCGTNVTVTLIASGITNANPCQTVYYQTWRAVDCCGNAALCTRTTTLVDTVPPILGCGTNFTVNAGQPWNFTTPIAGDDCCPGPIVVLAITTNVSGCNVSYTRYLRAFDCCGNASPICSQTVTVLGVGGPPNDLCANAIPLVLNGAYACGSNICATPSPIGTFTPPVCMNSAGYRDVWFTVVAQCTGPMTVDTCQPCPPHPTFDTVLSAYTGNCASLVQVPAVWPQVSCNDDACGLQSIITFPAVAGQTYRIRVTGWANAVGWFAIRATQNVAPNDACQNAPMVNVGNPAACGSTLCASPTQPGVLFPVPCGSSANTPDVWYRFTPQCSGTVTIDTCGTCPPNGTFDTVLSVYTGNCGFLLEVPNGCNDDSGPNGSCPWTLQSVVSFPATACTTYYIRVSGWAGSVGTFRLNINQTVPVPANDLCANATPVTAGSYPWSNCGANTDGPGNPCGLFRDVWFKYTPTCSGLVTVNTCLSCVDSVLAVYSGNNCGALPFLGCNDDAVAGPCASTLQSYLTFNAVANTTYRIRVGTYLSSPTGGGTLNIVGPNPAAQNCGTGGGPAFRLFIISGSGNGTPWSWSLSSPCCANLNANVVGVVGPAIAVANAFAGSINTLCPGTAFAFALNPTNAFLFVSLNCGPTAPVTMRVGPFGAAPANMCVVGSLILPTTGPCSFNPDIYEVPLTGHDLNGNDVDDFIDIATGASADVNGNLIPDETESCFGPQFTTKPDSHLVELGQNITLNAAVSGTPPFSYQWLFNGAPIAGATGSSLAVNPVTAAQLGSYSVTASNACGVAADAAAAVVTLPVSLPVLYDANLEYGTFRFTVDTKLGYSYVVEYKDDLLDPAWTPLQSVAGSGGPQLILDGDPPAQMRYYRVTQQPSP